MTLPPANPLLADLAAGRQEAYATLYDRMGASLLRVARAMSADAAESEDAVQEVFASLVRHRQRFSQVVDLQAYVFAMLRHEVIRRLGKRRRELAHWRDRVSMNSGMDGHDRPDGPDEDLQAALAALPDVQRQIVALKIDGGLTFAQIAEIVKISPNTAASRYRYALEKLREILKGKI